MEVCEMKEIQSLRHAERVGMKMWPLMRALAMAGFASAILGGCTLLDSNTSYSAVNAPELKIRPLPLITRGEKSPDGYYALGKYYLYQGRLEQAKEAFWDAVRLDSGHADALNGLGVVYDRLGLYDSAQKVYEAALINSPEAAYVWANLGYSLILAGKNSESIAPLQKAVALDPSNSVARLHLASIVPETMPAVAALAQAEKKINTSSEVPVASIVATQEVAAAEPKSPPNRLTDVGVAKHERPVANLASAQAKVETLNKSGSVIASVVNQSHYDVGIIKHQIAPKVSAAQNQAVVSGAKLIPVASHSETGTSRMLDGLRIEVSNGNGVNGMARAVGTEMSQTGLNIARITNARPFNKLQTLIMCRPELKSAAMELAKTMPTKPKIVLRDVAYRRVDVRVVLGADTSLAWKDGHKSPYLLASLGR